jgi:hypothetical protein
MPTILSRLRGLVAPTALDEPLRLADAGGVVPSTGGAGGGIILLRGRDGEDGKNGIGVAGAPGATGATGATGAAGPSSPQQPPGAAWINFAQGLPIVPPVNAVPRLISGTYNILECVVLTEGGPGSCVIKVWKANLSSHYPPISSDDITGGNNVVLSSTSTHDDSTLTGWTTGLVQGDILLFSLASSSAFSYVQINLRIG